MSAICPKHGLPLFVCLNCGFAECHPRGPEWVKMMHGECKLKGERMSEVEHRERENGPFYQHRPRSFTFCYTGCGLVVSCETPPGRADDPHFRTRTGAKAYWAARHPNPQGEPIRFDGQGTPYRVDPVTGHTKVLTGKRDP